MKSDFRRRFASLDRYDVPDLLAEIETRSAMQAPLVEKPHRRQVLTRVALAIAVVGGSLVGVYGLSKLFPSSPSAVNPGSLQDGTIVVGVVERDRSAFYAVDPQGGRLQQLLRLPGAGSPALSPDGSKVTYVRYGENDRGVWVANADGSHEVRLTEATANNDYEPAWSPDGRTIVFGHNEIGHTELFLIGADGERLRRLTTNEVGQDDAPDWSPSGEQIAFGRNSGGPSDIWVTDAGGGKPRRLTRLAEESQGVSDPDWSPDGSRIAFVGPGMSESPTDVYVIGADGEGLLRFEGPGDDADPVWSPDGTRIAFLSNRDHPNKVYDQSRLEETPQLGEFLEDHPELAFGEMYDLFLLDVATGEVEKLVGSVGENVSALEWRPEVNTSIPDQPTEEEERPWMMVEAEKHQVRGAQLNGSALEITCASRVTTVPSETAVQASPDGVHLIVENASGGPSWVAVGLDGSWPHEKGAVLAVASLPEQARYEVIAPIPPGRASVACGPGVSEPDGGVRIETAEFAQAEFLPLTVDDPSGFFTPVTPDCAIEDRAALSDERRAFVDPYSPVDFVREVVPGILKTDQVERAGYADVPEPWQWVRVIRDGMIIAGFWPHGAGSGSILASDICVGSGVGGL